MNAYVSRVQKSVRRAAKIRKFIIVLARAIGIREILENDDLRARYAGRRRLGFRCIKFVTFSIARELFEARTARNV